MGWPLGMKEFKIKKLVIIMITNFFILLKKIKIYVIIVIVNKKG